MGPPLYAYRVVVETAGSRTSYVVAGKDLAEAASSARGRIEDGSRLVALEQLAELLAWPHEPLDARRRLPHAEQPVAGPGAAAPDEDRVHPVPTPRRGTRRDQLLELLRLHGKPLHLSFVAEALSITRGHADQVAREAIKGGLLKRVGSRTGKIRLVQAKPAPAPTTTAKPVPKAASTGPVLRQPPGVRGSSRVEQLVASLRQRGGEAHVIDLATDLETNRGNADNVVRVASKAGLVERVGRRTGRVRLVAQGTPTTAQASERGVAAEEPARPKLDPTALTGMHRRVWSVIDGDAGWSTARDVASQLGCRPREAGNALVLLVGGGLVEREVGDGTPGRPARYRAGEGSRPGSRTPDGVDGP